MARVKGGVVAKNRRRKVDNGAHWLKFVPYPIMDKDLKNNLFHKKLY